VSRCSQCDKKSRQEVSTKRPRAWRVKHEKGLHCAVCFRLGSQQNPRRISDSLGPPWWSRTYPTKSDCYKTGVCSQNNCQFIDISVSGGNLLSRKRPLGKSEFANCKWLECKGVSRSQTVCLWDYSAQLKPLPPQLSDVRIGAALSKLSTQRARPLRAGSGEGRGKVWTWCTSFISFNKSDQFILVSRWTSGPNLMDFSLQAFLSYRGHEDEADGQTAAVDRCKCVVKM